MRGAGGRRPHQPSPQPQPAAAAAARLQPADPSQRPEQPHLEHSCTSGTGLSARTLPSITWPSTSHCRYLTVPVPSCPSSLLSPIPVPSHPNTFPSQYPPVPVPTRPSTFPSPVPVPSHPNTFPSPYPPVTHPSSFPPQSLPIPVPSPRTGTFPSLTIPLGITSRGLEAGEKLLGGFRRAIKPDPTTSRAPSRAEHPQEPWDGRHSPAHQRGTAPWCSPALR